MRATHLIYKAAGQPAVPSKYKQVKKVSFCAVCGSPARWDLSDLLGDSFTNWASCARPDSTVACAACLFCLKEPALKLGGFLALGTIEGTRAAQIFLFETTAQTVTRLRSPQGKQSAILSCELPSDAAVKCGVEPRASTNASPLVRVLPRAEFWLRCLESPPEPPFACALNVAGGMPLPRHMPIVTRVAADRDAYPVTYCLESLMWEPSIWAPAYRLGAEALVAGLWIRELTTGQYRNQALTEHRALVRRVEAVLAPLRGRQVFDLLIDMLPRKRDSESSDANMLTPEGD
jgi:hypothetical protein